MCVCVLLPCEVGDLYQSRQHQDGQCCHNNLSTKLGQHDDKMLRRLLRFRVKMLKKKVVLFPFIQPSLDVFFRVLFVYHPKSSFGEYVLFRIFCCLFEEKMMQMRRNETRSFQIVVLL